MSEKMTMDEIESRFKDEWILIEDPETNEVMQVLRGKVLWHGKDKDELYRQAMKLQPKYAAFWYTGKWPDGQVVIL